MLKKLMTLLVVLLCMTSLCGMSQTTSSSGTGENTETRSLLLLLSKSSDRKRTPSKAFVEAIYMNGMIRVDSELNGEFQTLTIENGDTGELVFASSIVPGEYVPVMLEEGIYKLTLEFMDGRRFGGEMYIPA